MKVVINDDYGGFSLSRAAFHLLRGMKQKNALKEPDYGENYSDGSGIREQICSHEAFLHDIPRDDPMLVEVVEKLGRAANGTLSSLKVVEIPDGVEWQIEGYDGSEWIAEKHRRWG